MSTVRTDGSTGNEPARKTVRRKSTDLVVVGREAAGTLAEAGFVIEATPTDVSRLRCEFLELGGLVLARVRVPVERLTLVASPGYRVVLPIDSDAGSPLKMSVSPAPTRLRAGRARGWLLIGLDAFHGTEPPLTARLIEAPVSAVDELLIAVAGVLLASTGDFDQRERAGLRTIVEEILRLVGSELLGSTASVATDARAEIARRALETISERASDVQFNVERLAAVLHISGPHLRRVMADAGTTAAAEISRARSERARELLRLGRGPEEQVARDAGFPSARTMRRHLGARHT